jgi:hypothetical protein
VWRNAALADNCVLPPGFMEAEVSQLTVIFPCGLLASELVQFRNEFSLQLERSKGIIRPFESEVGSLRVSRFQ